MALDRIDDINSPINQEALDDGEIIFNRVGNQWQAIVDEVYSAPCATKGAAMVDLIRAWLEHKRQAEELDIPW